MELRKKDFVTQALSAESFGMGIFYTVNVFWIQFYLGAHVPPIPSACAPVAENVPDLTFTRDVDAQWHLLSQIMCSKW